MGRGRSRKPVQDLRSTGRKRARATLLQAVQDGLVEFKCAVCGWFPVGIVDRSNTLDCNHINKNLEDTDLVNLEWLCRPHHKEKDSQTEKGVSLKNDEYGYNLGDLGL